MKQASPYKSILQNQAFIGERKFSTQLKNKQTYIISERVYKYFLFIAPREKKIIVNNEKFSYSLYLLSYIETRYFKQQLTLTGSVLPCIFSKAIHRIPIQFYTINNNTSIILNFLTQKQIARCQLTLREFPGMTETQ